MFAREMYRSGLANPTATYPKLPSGVKMLFSPIDGNIFSRNLRVAQGFRHASVLHRSLKSGLRGLRRECSVWASQSMPRVELPSSQDDAARLAKC